MDVLKKIRDALLDPRVKDIDVDGEERMAVHRQIFSEKQMMKGVFYDFYHTCLDIDKSYFHGEGRRVEIGSGVSLFKKVAPDIISTDVIPDQHLDIVLDAQNMNFRDASIRAIFGINCFHHFPNPDSFFKELTRVLVPGGGCALIEPYYGILATPFYKNLHRIEYFNKEQVSWSNLKGAMTNANQALSYIVFKRDRNKFCEYYPELEILESRTLSNYLRYLCSGGVNFRQLLPDFMIPILKMIEWVLYPFESILALHHVIVIRKRR